MQVQGFQFIKKITLFTLIIGIAVVVLRIYLPEKYYTPVFPFLVVFFYATNIIIYNVIIKATEKRINSFVNYFMVASFLKLLLFIIVLGSYVYFRRNDAVPFTISFLFLYIFYTVFEISTLLKTVQKKES
jgi:hypothetical protein